MIRAALYLPEFLPISHFRPFLYKNGQKRLGDLAANTIVTREPKIPRPDLEQILCHKYNSLRDHPHLVARLRQRTSPHEANIALQALLRRDELDPLSRLDLFAQVAAHFKKIMAFPQETIDGITDEQFVRNVVDVLVRALGTSKRSQGSR